MKVRTIHLIIGALGTVSKTLESRMDEVGIRRKVDTPESLALPGPEIVLKKVLEIERNLLSVRQR